MKHLGCVFLFLVVVSCNLSPGFKEKDSDRKEVKLTPPVYISELSEVLEETSGLIVFDDHLWSLNDSDGKNELYALNNDGEIVVTVELDGATNVDWEALAQDEDFIYVGDFGNNKGNRTDLKVYKISKSALETQEQSIKVSAEEINFSYAEQNDFTEREYLHEFDCEAMFSSGDYLYLFSKDWKNFKTNVYKLPKIPGNYSLIPEGSFNVNGLISGADIRSDGNYFALVGYEIGGYNYVVPFVYLFEFTPGEIFSKKSVFFNLNSIGGAQTEGLVFLNDSQIVISNERTDSYIQQAFLINFADYLSHFE